MSTVWQPLNFTDFIILPCLAFAGGPMVCACGRYSALVSAQKHV